jgi:hypothetical protein
VAPWSPILLDVTFDLLELALISHALVVALFLQKELPYGVGRSLVMPFSDFVSFGKAKAGVASR